MSRLLLHAPGVHTGGGLVLLKELLRASEKPLAWCALDERALTEVKPPLGTKVRIVRRSGIDRLAAEFELKREAREGDVAVCFHGIPPLLPSPARVVVFLQNRNYLRANPLSTFNGWTKVRIAIERALCKVFQSNVDEYIVQTPAMARLVMIWHGGSPVVRVLPFLDLTAVSASPGRVTPEFDFVYVADGEAHKNHAALLEAWVLLSRENLRPSLALTLGQRHKGLASTIDSTAALNNLAIKNVGEMPRADIMSLYGRSRALIYPSTSESFAIPLVEANAIALPIVASELDYVRDVSSPVETFDPFSPVSIARAVKRFLGSAETPLEIHSPREFVARLNL